MSTINWSNVKDIQSQNTRRQLKIIFSFQKKDVHTIFINGNDLPKSIWDLYNRNAKNITVTDLQNNVLFQFINTDITISSINLQSGFMGDCIKNWNGLTSRNKDTMLRILLSEILETT